MPVVTTSQMREVDTRSIQGNTEVGFMYMGLAAKGLLKATMEMVPDSSSLVGIICGKGNNGGDGYLLGQMLLDHGYSVTCYALCHEDDLGGEARMAYDRYAGRGGEVRVVGGDTFKKPDFGGCAVLVDGILGTGLRGNPRGIAADAIRALNESGLPVIAVDTPSGVDNDTGALGEPAVKANRTVTMGFSKLGQYYYPGRGNIGLLTVADLEYPEEIVSRVDYVAERPDITDLSSMLPARIQNGSKFDHGLVLAVAGSRGMTGSISLAAMAALRSGCGMVHCAVPQSSVSVLATKLTEPVIHPIDETSDGTASEMAADGVIRMSGKMQAAFVGPGLSHLPETTAFVRRVVASASLPIVLDADGLNAYKGYTEDLKKHPGPLIITPHDGEWGRLFDPLPSDPVSALPRMQSIAEEFDLIIVRKGNPTVIIAPAAKPVVVPAGNSGMASAGTGDVLTGIIASFLGQGSGPRAAAVLGACVHGLCGETAARKMGEHAVIAHDLIDALPSVLCRLGSPHTFGMLWG